MRIPLPILRPLLLIAALPLTALACLSAMNPSRKPAAAAARPAPAAEGPFVWVSNEGSGDPNGGAGTVSVIDVATRTLAATSRPFGQRVWGIALTPDGRRLYAADGPANDVAVLDAATLAVQRRIPAGDAPWGVAIARSP